MRRPRFHLAIIAGIILIGAVPCPSARMTRYPRWDAEAAELPSDLQVAVGTYLVRRHGPGSVMYPHLTNDARQKLAQAHISTGSTSGVRYFIDHAEWRTSADVYVDCFKDTKSTRWGEFAAVELIRAREGWRVVHETQPASTPQLPVDAQVAVYRYLVASSNKPRSVGVLISAAREVQEKLARDHVRLYKAKSRSDHWLSLDIQRTYWHRNVAYVDVYRERVWPGVMSRVEQEGTLRVRRSNGRWQVVDLRSWADV